MNTLAPVWALRRLRLRSNVCLVSAIITGRSGRYVAMSLFCLASLVAQLSRRSSDKANKTNYARCSAKVVAALTAALGVFLGVARAGELVRIPSRDGVTVGVFWEGAEKPIGNVLLFPGGAGGFGRVENGKPNGGNFLVRSHTEFRNAGYNVAIMGRPSDVEDLSYENRITDWHLKDVKAAIDAVKTKNALPIWLIGTSRGTVSIAHTAIHHRDERIAGIVLSSSIVNYKATGALPKQKLADIIVPTLLVHHAKDACHHCLPHEVKPLLAQLTRAPRKALIMIDGGHSPTGDVCQAQHWHGFVNYEAETVKQMVDWMAKR